MSENAMQDFIGTPAVVEKPQPLVVHDTGPDAILTAIMRAAETPGFNVDAMERLLSMHERMQERQATAGYNAALAELQPKLPVITQRGKITIGNNVQKYALWEDIIEVIRPLLHEAGFALSFRVGQEGDLTTVTGVLSHKDGHSEQTTIKLPADKSGCKNSVQAVGSSVSYGKRYTASALLNIISKGEDDDGKTAGQPKVITAEQKEQIIALMKETNADTAKFLEFMGVDNLDELPFDKFQKAINMLNAKKKQAQK